MPTITFTWNTVHDGRTCDKCNELSGYTWYFYDEMPKVLLHPHLGLVWDLVLDQSRAHGYPSRRGYWNCRCYVEWVIDDPDLQEGLEELRVTTEQLDGRISKTLMLMEQFHALLLGVLS